MKKCQAKNAVLYVLFLGQDIVLNVRIRFMNMKEYVYIPECTS